MTDDLRERVARRIAVCIGCPPEKVPCADECGCMLVTDNVLNLFEPGDVLPNGWVAPDEATIEMLGTTPAETLPGRQIYQAAYKAFRAAAINSRKATTEPPESGPSSGRNP